MNNLYKNLVLLFTVQWKFKYITKIFLFDSNHPYKSFYLIFFGNNYLFTHISNNNIYLSLLTYDKIKIIWSLVVKGSEIKMLLIECIIDRGKKVVYWDHVPEGEW